MLHSRVGSCGECYKLFTAKITSLTAYFSINFLSYAKSDVITAVESFITLAIVELTHNYTTRLKRLARDKHSSLLLKVVTRGRKKFYNIGARLTSETLKVSLMKIATFVRLSGTWTKLTTMSFVLSRNWWILNVTNPYQMTDAKR